MILGLNKHAWGKHNQFIKLVGGIVGFIGENLGKAKGLRYLNFFFSHIFVFYYGVSMSIRSG
jgi:sulfite exporter TauE/SafE